MSQPEESIICPICLDEDNKDELLDVCEKSEKHKIHKQCVTNILKFGGNKKCPICRSPLKAYILNTLNTTNQNYSPFVINSSPIDSLLLDSLSDINIDEQREIESQINTLQQNRQRMLEENRNERDRLEQSRNGRSGDRIQNRLIMNQIQLREEQLNQFDPFIRYNKRREQQERNREEEKRKREEDRIRQKQEEERRRKQYQNLQELKQYQQMLQTKLEQEQQIVKRIKKVEEYRRRNEEIKRKQDEKKNTVLNYLLFIIIFIVIILFFIKLNIFKKN
jgi:DNA repair exonuclease SbcCD ATPase subunit